MKSSGRNKKENLDLYINRLFEIQEDLDSVNSLDKLIKVRTKYLIWDEELRQFFQNNNTYNSLAILINRNVKRKFFEGKLTGLMFWGDKKSQEILNIIKKEVIEKIEIIEKLTPVNQWDKIIQKRGGTFYYLGNPVSIGEQTIYYHLLDILISLSNQNGFLSYEKIILEIKKRFKKGLFKDNIKEITQKTISNAKDYLFLYSRINKVRFKNLNPNGKELIEVVRGKGLKINNDKL